MPAATIGGPGRPLALSPDDFSDLARALYELAYALRRSDLLRGEALLSMIRSGDCGRAPRLALRRKGKL